jgi:hypothetical protein
MIARAPGIASARSGRSRVVDGDDFVFLAEQTQDFVELIQERDQILSLVVDGQNDTDVHGRPTMP